MLVLVEYGYLDAMGTGNQKYYPLLMVLGKVQSFVGNSCRLRRLLMPILHGGEACSVLDDTWSIGCWLALFRRTFEPQGTQSSKVNWRHVPKKLAFENIIAHQRFGFVVYRYTTLPVS